MGAKNRSQNYTQFYKLKVPKDSETNTPFFFKSEKKDDKWVETESFNEITGYLRGIGIKPYEFEGKQKESIEIMLQDDETGEEIKIETAFSYMTRSMLNSLASCESYGLLSLQAASWGKKGEDKFPRVFVKNDGQKTNWKYSVDQFPKVEVLKNKKGEVVSQDSTDVDDFFKNVIKDDILPKIGNTPVVTAATQSHKNETAEPIKIDGKGKTSELIPDNLPKWESDLPF